MAPIKSSLARSASKLFGVFRERDISLRGYVQTERKLPPFEASGGLTYEPGNGYKYHVFTYPNSDTFTVTSVGDVTSVEAFLVAGGGSGNGPYGSGGGGGGGIVYATTVPITATTYPISVGDGGTSGGSGSPSTVFGLTAVGGGGGSTSPYDAGLPGGSGGGEGLATQPTYPQPLPAPSYTQYGNNGGTGSGGSGSAGGGGAGQAGGSYPPYTQGGAGAKGGDGQPFPQFAYPLVGLSPLIPSAKSPTNDHYGGGGGGWGYAGTNPNGGYGGGGDGHQYSAGPFHQAGVDKLGGGSGHWITPIPAPQDTDKDGGSGIVIIRYAV
jgi:hypothetical protein